jgi:hypothetical protein
MVKDFIEIRECGSLDALIDNLVAARESLPAGSEAEVRLRGDDVFGRQIAISYFRPQTAEEMECDARYVTAYRESRQRELVRLEEEHGVVAAPSQRLRRLRVVGA